MPDIFGPVLPLLERLSIVPGNITLYETACVHRSFLNESPDHITEHNERLEFLGDAALELAMTHIIYTTYPDRDEGWMTDLRSSFVRGTNLADVALQYDFDDAICMSQGERNAGGNKNPGILADMFEALLGALYLDQGFEAVLSLVSRVIFQSSAISETKDPKSKLQELVQKFKKIPPTYAVVHESGKDHEKIFHIAVSIDDTRIGSGVGTNKKNAQESAALDALANQEKWKSSLENNS